MTRSIRWGILSTGDIAHHFATGLGFVPDAELVAVGSRTQESADRFGDEFNIPHRHASYESLVNDPDVDVVYIGTPHNFHRDNTILCLNAGKHVLCEKPLMINAKEVAETIDLAGEQGLFMMEAMWSRFFPVQFKLRELLKEQVIGEIMYVQVDFGFRNEVVPEHRLFNPDLAGGALLDLGIYPLSFISMVFGKQPERIATLAHLGETGVDELSVMSFAYGKNQAATVMTSLRVETPHGAWICGTEGRIYVEDFWHSSEMTLYRKGQAPEHFPMPIIGNGYNYQAVEVGDCIRAGKLESEIMPLDESFAILQTMDRIRADWGLKYPME